MEKGKKISRREKNKNKHVKNVNTCSGERGRKERDRELIYYSLNRLSWNFT